MTFLKKFGLAIVKIVGIVSGFIPVASAVASNVSGGNQKVEDTFSKIGAAVMTAEAMAAALAGGPVPPGSAAAGLTGPQKLQMISPIVGQIVQTSELLAGKKVHDEAKFITACQTITGGVADLLNSLE